MPKPCYDIPIAYPYSLHSGFAYGKGLQSFGSSCFWAFHCFAMDSKELSSISDCFGDQKAIKTPKLNTIWLELIARVLNMPIGLKGNNYYSKVFKRVNYKLWNNTFWVVIRRYYFSFFILRSKFYLILELLILLLPYPLCMHYNYYLKCVTPYLLVLLWAMLRIKRMCRACSITILDDEVKTYLFFLKMLGYDVILGMKFLSTYHAIIDC